LTCQCIKRWHFNKQGICPFLFSELQRRSACVLRYVTRLLPNTVQWYKNLHHPIRLPQSLPLWQTWPAACQRRSFTTYSICQPLLLALTSSKVLVLTKSATRTAAYACDFSITKICAQMLAVSPSCTAAQSLGLRPGYRSVLLPLQRR
jgi:hypothetical protein